MDYLVKDTSLIAIAESIRNKTGDNMTMTLDEMSTAIENIETKVEYPSAEGVGF